MHLFLRLADEIYLRCRGFVETSPEGPNDYPLAEMKRLMNGALAVFCLK
jgi:hypothetical protein